MDTTVLLNKLAILLHNHDIYGVFFIIAGSACIAELHIGKKTPWPWIAFILPFIVTIVQLFYYLEAAEALQVITNSFINHHIYVRHLLLQFALFLGAIMIILKQFHIIKNKHSLLMFGFALFILGQVFISHTTPDRLTYDYDQFFVNTIGLLLIICSIVYILEIHLPKHENILRMIWSLLIIVIGFIFIVIKPYKSIAIGDYMSHPHPQPAFISYIIEIFIISSSIIVLYVLCRALIKYFKNLD